LAHAGRDADGEALEQLELPLPPGIRCKAKLSLRKDDDGGEHNRVRSFDVLGIDKPEDDDFAPAPKLAPSGDTVPPGIFAGDSPRSAMEGGK
jgi:hypothetical protein